MKSGSKTTESAWLIAKESPALNGFCSTTAISSRTFSASAPGSITISKDCGVPPSASISPRPRVRLSLPAKRKAAKDAGAAHVVNGGLADAAGQIIDLTQGGAWAVIDLVGSSPSARVGYDSLIKGGKYIIVGRFGGNMTVSLPPIPMRALTIQGSYVGSVPEMAELMELVRRTGAPQVPVATKPLDDVNAVMQDLRAGKVIGRVVLTP